MIGKVFGRLTVSSREPNSKSGKLRWKCLCSCGNHKTVQAGNLTSGNTKSCGCLQKEVVKESVTTHGMSQSSEYWIWNTMKDRCLRPSHGSYKYYGDRGIDVCERWQESFENFYQDMGPRPGKEFSLERENNNKGYSKDNCRWATAEEQANNKRNNIRLNYRDTTYTVSQLAPLMNLTYLGLYKRIRKARWANNKTTINVNEVYYELSR